MPQSEPSLVIFDCDGVLVDSEVLACELQARALGGYGLALTGAEVARRFLGMSAKDMRAALEADLGRPLPGEHESRCAAELFELFRRELKPVPGMRDVIGTLRHLRCVASSSTPDRIALALRVTGLADLFGHHVFSSTMVARGKPAPDLFLHAAVTMGVPPAGCVVVEDSPNGIKAARAAGMIAIGFLGGRHCGPDHAKVLREAGAHRVCANAAELAGVLASGRAHRREGARRRARTKAGDLG